MTVDVKNRRVRRDQTKLLRVVRRINSYEDNKIYRPKITTVRQNPLFSNKDLYKLDKEGIHEFSNVNELTLLFYDVIDIIFLQILYML